RVDDQHGLQPDRCDAHDSLGEALDGSAVDRLPGGRRAGHRPRRERLFVVMGTTEARANRVQLLSTILLAVAAGTTAWCSYQASRWTAEYRAASGHTNAVRLEAARAQGLVEAEKQVDVATFTQWVDAYALQRRELADFYFRRFRNEFRPAVTAWFAT